jgi:hypothetical protein
MTDTQSTTPVKSIPTEYAGHTFRSRLEARWAAFFDYANIQWSYEPEGYELPSGRYLPDFWLPEIEGGCWFEVKGQSPTRHESDLAFELARVTGSSAYIAWGQIPADMDPSSGVAHPTFDIELHEAEGWDNSRRFCVCPVCGKPGLQFDGRGERVCRHGGDSDCPTWQDERFTSAFYLARTYSFWSPK